MTQVRIYVDVVADLFHRGHVEMLKKVKNMEENVFLLVGVHSDEVCEEYKRKPFFSMEDRAEILRACRYVDQVIEDVPICVPRELIEEYEIDIVAHGEDMTKYLKDVAYKVPIDMGIMRTFPYHDGISTTQIIEMIKER
jgi:cytidyltransferase-like protein